VYLVAADEIEPGLVLTALGIGLALPTASIAVTSGVQPRDQGLAGVLLLRDTRVHGRHE
jgi:hypothetical protein